MQLEVYQVDDDELSFLSMLICLLFHAITIVPSRISIGEWISCDRAIPSRLSELWNPEGCTESAPERGNRIESDRVWF